MRLRATALLWVFAAALANAASNPPQMFAHFINVGQANATLLEFPCGAVLIDAGAQDEDTARYLIDYLGNFFREHPAFSNKLEAIYITHPHKDHTYALRRVIQAFGTKRFIENGQDYGSGIANVRWVRSIASRSNIVVRVLLNSQVMTNHQMGVSDATLDPIKCEDCDPEIRILSGQWEKNPGWKDEEYKNNNNHSLVIRVDFGEAGLLFTGDLEEDGIESFLSYYRTVGNLSEILDVDIYHVGHHGSYNGTTTNLVDAMSPEIAVISVGKWNDGRGSQNPFTTWAYGHPRRILVDLLAKRIPKNRSAPVIVNVGTAARRFFPILVKKKVYATAWDGDLKIRATLNREFMVYRGSQ